MVLYRSRCVLVTQNATNRDRGKFSGSSNFAFQPCYSCMFVRGHSCPAATISPQPPQSCISRTDTCLTAGYSCWFTTPSRASMGDADGPPTTRHGPRCMERDDCRHFAGQSSRCLAFSNIIKMRRRTKSLFFSIPTASQWSGNLVSASAVRANEAQDTRCRIGKSVTLE
jgi:hypothetical protein